MPGAAGELDAAWVLLGMRAAVAVRVSGASDSGSWAVVAGAAVVVGIAGYTYSTRPWSLWSLPQAPFALSFASACQTTTDTHLRGAGRAF